jgi:hypothetical protein
VFRHTALFLLRPDTTRAAREEMLRRLGTLREACRTVRGEDFGENALPGLGLPGAYDVALHLDFDDPDGYAAYFEDPAHKDVAAFNASISVAERTARVDWLPQEEPSAAVRHVAMIAWKAGAEAGPVDRLLELGALRGVISATAAANAGDDPRAWDAIFDARFDDLGAARDFVTGAAYADALAALAPAVDAGRTVHVTHVTASPGRR